jgi:hypothetical protein
MRPYDSRKRKEAARLLDGAVQTIVAAYGCVNCARADFEQQLRELMNAMLHDRMAPARCDDCRESRKRIPGDWHEGMIEAAAAVAAGYARALEQQGGVGEQTEFHAEMKAMNQGAHWVRQQLADNPPASDEQPRDYARRFRTIVEASAGAAAASPAGCWTSGWTSALASAQNVVGPDAGNGRACDDDTHSPQPPRFLERQPPQDERP